MSFTILYFDLFNYNVINALCFILIFHRSLKPGLLR